jgi:two-component system sensor histidine kinase KdpD
VQYAHDIDVTLVGVKAAKEARERHASIPMFAGVRNETRSSPNAYVYATAIGVAITALAGLLSRHIDLTNLVMLYLLGVVFAAVRLGRGPGVLLSFLSVAAFDFFFVPPQFSFSVSDTQYLLTFFVMLLTSLTISHLTSNLRRQARVASLRERRTGAMYAMTRELGGALMTEQIIEIGTRHVGEIFQAKVAILLPDSSEKVRQKVDDPNPQVTLDAGDLDLDIAQWVYDQQCAVSAAQGADAYTRCPRANHR